MSAAGVPITAELLRKHDRPGPRYTSYPTAVEFHDGIGEAQYQEKLAPADALANEPLSFYFHLPFCHERCTFCGCHVTITRRTERATEYLAHLYREIDLVAQHLPHRRTVAQYHWGGGTPTYHSPAELRQLHRTVCDRFEILPWAEVATTIAGDHGVIFAGSGNKEAAYKWLEFVSAPDNMIELNVGTPDYPSALLPPRESLLNDPTLYETRRYMQGFKDNLQCAYVPEADQPRYYEAQLILGEALGRAFYGEIDGKTAVIESVRGS